MTLDCCLFGKMILVREGFFLTRWNSTFGKTGTENRVLVSNDSWMSSALLANDSSEPAKAKKRDSLFIVRDIFDGVR